MESNSNNALVRVESIQSTEIVTEDMEILQTLNLSLQVKVHNLETDIDRLKKEVHSYKGKTFIYESLTKDLSSLRKQFDKTAVALLRKCEAYDELKKEVAELKAKSHKSPKGIATPIRRNKVIPVGNNLRSRLRMDEEEINFSSDDEYPLTTRRVRPSMGSCGSIASQIAAENGMPARMQAYAAPTAPLRNRVLMKLHSIKSASTESLESTGRKSIRVQEKKQADTDKAAKSKVTLRNKKPRTNLDTSAQSAKGSSGNVKAMPAPAYRPALGPSNGQRLVKITNLASIKRSNSNCSTKSTPGPASKPVFRF